MASDAMTLEAQIATRLRALRQTQALSLAELAERSGVSKAMISKIERAESSPTATVLGRLAAGLAVPLAQLLAEDAPTPQRLRPLIYQDVWIDPGVGYQRRQVAPHDPQTGIELVEIVLPIGAQVRYPPWSGRLYRQRLWLVMGALQVGYGDERFVLAAGDCLDFGVDRPLLFQALGPTDCRYLLVSSAA